MGSRPGIDIDLEPDAALRIRVLKTAPSIHHDISVLEIDTATGVHLDQLAARCGLRRFGTSLWAQLKDENRSGVFIVDTFPTPARKYLPTLAELIDRLTIVQLKEIFISENRAEYRAERALIEHDIDLLLAAKPALGARAIHAIAMIMLTNHWIWTNESKARAGGAEQDKLLKFTHSVNGVRNQAKNVLSRQLGERVDLKIDCFASELVKELGAWQVFDADE